MGPVSGVNGASSSPAVLGAQISMAVAKKGLDAQKFMGEAAVNMIRSASLDPMVGRNLDILA